MHWLLIRGKKREYEEKNCLLSHHAKTIMTSLVPRTVYVFMCPLRVTTKGRKRAHSSSPFCPPSLAISCEFRQNRKQRFLFQSSWAALGGTGQGNSPGSADDRDDFALGVTSEPLYFTMESVSVYFRLFIDIRKHLQLTVTWKTSLQNRCWFDSTTLTKISLTSTSRRWNSWHFFCGFRKFYNKYELPS